MQGYSPKLPLSIDATDGLYSMNKTAIDTIKQDLKMLVLTNPGERIMLPNYGVGLRRLLFSQNSDELQNVIENNISTQVQRYMSFVSINNIQIDQIENNENAYMVKIEYYIPSMNSVQELNLSLGSN